MQTWVLFRDAQGAAACVRDECAHRACPLSLGRVVDGQIECPYHGALAERGRLGVEGAAPCVIMSVASCLPAWPDILPPLPPRTHIPPAAGWQYDRGGECTKMPSTAFCKVWRYCRRRQRYRRSTPLPCSPPRHPPPCCPPAHPITTLVPALLLLQDISVESLPVVELDGLVWVWPGQADAITGGPPAVARPPPGFRVHAGEREG